MFSTTYLDWILTTSKNSSAFSFSRCSICLHVCCNQGNQKRRNKSRINLFQDHTKRVCTFFRFTFLSFSCRCVFPLTLIIYCVLSMRNILFENSSTWKNVHTCTEGMLDISHPIFCSVLFLQRFAMIFHSASSSSWETLSLGIKCRSNSCFQRTETSVTRGYWKNCRNLSNVMGNVGFGRRN